MSLIRPVTTGGHGKSAFPVERYRVRHFQTRNWLFIFLMADDENIPNFFSLPPQLLLPVVAQCRESGIKFLDFRKFLVGVF